MGRSGRHTPLDYRRKVPARLEDLTPGTAVGGVVPGEVVTVVATEWHGSSCLTLTYRRPSGEPADRLVYRDDEPSLIVDQHGAAFAFDADGELFRLAAEARRIQLAHLFDPRLAVHLSLLEPLPHQIQAVYGEMLPRHPLRFALCDDPGAGKTIMAGLYIKELLLRGDLRRCLIVAPGSLVTQWQDELSDRFGLKFAILTRDMIEATKTADPFAEQDLLIARLDHLSRNEDLIDRLRRSEWDLAVVDEAHRMSAHYFGNELKETKRYRLGKVLGHVARHLLLMTATPHAGKEEDFQLFLALLDADRFEGRQRDGVPDRRERSDAADGQGAAAAIRRHAAVPGTTGLHRHLSTIGRRGCPVHRGHRLRHRGDEPGRPAHRRGRRTARQPRRLRCSPSSRDAWPPHLKRSTAHSTAGGSSSRTAWSRSGQGPEGRC